ncbi:glycosyltransferase family 4 protein [Reichenbachiella carrageenanivorans]|uniref:Glycosyltransferase family 4 protein n=1 Tax=Reichenbachiella carrageenanivorans TaxID=2979869 RepID=A0ABY6D586_9BACT|nr:glycosyltransferase family 4 protein [Reichenbachiella carrageenanivorans]UXX80283.1 glycosyltransferase family 4 protein [Reichenbachiella carrageenanivorans]
MPKILYIHQYFKSPADGGSLRSYYLARALSAHFQVTMITAYNGSTRHKKNVDGIDVVYLPVAYANEMSFSRRGWAFVRFMILAMLESCRHRNIDLCYVMTTPLSTGVVALFNKWVLGRKYIFEVGDLWPQVPIDMGLLQGVWKQKMLKVAERLFYQKASGLVGLSEPITAYLQSVAPAVSCETVYNIADCDRFIPASKNRIQNQFVISYTGTFGLANDLAQIIDWAEAVQDLPVRFVLVGDGAEKLKVTEWVKTKGLNHVAIYDTMGKEEVQEVVNATDAMLVSFADVPSLHTGSPNKFFDALAAGKLVVTNFGGWIGDLIVREKCGFFASSPAAFREQLEVFLSDKEQLQTYQSNARQLAEERYSLAIQSSVQMDYIVRILTK